jgi:cytochrome c2
MPLIVLMAVLVATAMLAGCGGSKAAATGVPGGDPGRGQHAIQRYGCGACHTIPGVAGARGAVGPPLAGLGSRAIIAGRVGNTPEHLVRWIEFPQAIEPGTAMPDLGVTEADARDIAAYLYTLR